MVRKYIERSLEPVLKRAVAEFPAVVLTGPRQSGKTTLLRHLFGADYRYVSLEPPDIRAVAREDPRGFLELNPPPAIFDEVQYAPDLLPYIKERIDARRDEYGQYLLTGSLNLLLTAGITESMAGRAAMLRLMPLSRREAEGRPQAPLPWENADSEPRKQPLPIAEMWKGFVRGGYPELALSPERDLQLWHASYAQTYLERDVRALRQVGDLSQFQSFLRALAARSGGLLNLADLGRDLGLALNTVKAWLSVLEATYQVFVLRPYHANVGKRLVKTPKIYFTDTGTLCYLTGVSDPEQASRGPLGGAIMETAVLSEILKTQIHRGIDPYVHFWRTSTGLEVDFLIEAKGHWVPAEVKLSATPKPSMASPIRALKEDLHDRLLPGYVIHPGDLRLPLGGGVIALPWGYL